MSVNIIRNGGGGGGPTTKIKTITKKIMPPGKPQDVLSLFCSFLFFFKTASTYLLRPVYHVDERPSYVTTALLLPSLTASWS